MGSYRSAVTALLGVVLLVTVAQGTARRAQSPVMHIGERQYILPNVFVDAVRKNHNCSVGRRELQSQLRRLKPSCKQSSGIEDGELLTIKEQGPSSHAGKCFLGCMMEGMGIINNGSFTRDGADRLVSTVYAEGSKRRSALRAVRACAEEVTTTEKCETGGLIFECFRKHRVGLFGSGGA